MTSMRFFKCAGTSTSSMDTTTELPFLSSDKRVLVDGKVITIRPPPSGSRRKSIFCKVGLADAATEGVAGVGAAGVAIDALGRLAGTALTTG